MNTNIDANVKADVSDAPTISLFEKGARLEFGPIKLVDEGSGASVVEVEDGLFRGEAVVKEGDEGFSLVLRGIQPGTIFPPETFPGGKRTILDAAVSFIANAAEKTLEAKRFEIGVRGQGVLSASLLLTGFDIEAAKSISSPEEALGILSQAMLSGASVKWTDEGLYEYVLETESKRAGISKEKVASDLLSMAEEISGTVKGVSFDGMKEFFSGERKDFTVSLDGQGIPLSFITYLVEAGMK